MTGFEVTWTQDIFTGLQHRLNLAYTYGQDKVRDEPLPEIAPLDFRYALIGNYLENKLRPEFRFRHVLKQERISSVFGETPSPSFSVVDLGLTYQFTKSLDASIGVQNLLDHAYYEHLNRSVRGETRAIHAPGRNIFLAVTLDLM